MASSKKIPLNYLVFDDEDEEKNQHSININISGIECNLIFINPTEFLDVDKNIFDIEAFKSEIDKKIKGLQINLIASDWNMVGKSKNYPPINAFEIIKILTNKNDKFKKIQYLIYSGKPNEVSNVLINEIKKELQTQDEPIYSKEILSLLLEMKLKFTSRGQRFEEIKTLINNNKTISLIVLNSLSQFDRNMVINTGNDHYDGKKIGILIDLISQENDLGLKFIREFIELSIAHYTILNEE